jgi:glycosyltransferase involved in cell wall biosynthesis
MAAGLPVVATRIAPLDDTVREGQEGALFPEGDVAALAGAIARLLADPQAAHAMGRRARERVVARYSWQRHCADLERILVELVGARRSANPAERYPDT